MKFDKQFKNVNYYQRQYVNFTILHADDFDAEEYEEYIIKFEDPSLKCCVCNQLTEWIYKKIKQPICSDDCMKQVMFGKESESECKKIT